MINIAKRKTLHLFKNIVAQIAGKSRRGAGAENTGEVSKQQRHQRHGDQNPGIMKDPVNPRPIADLIDQKRYRIRNQSFHHNFANYHYRRQDGITLKFTDRLHQQSDSFDHPFSPFLIN